MYTLETLLNGLRLVVARSSGTEAASILVQVKVGSRYETRDISGAAHFIEHMMFKGTKRHKSARELSRKLEQFGADYNAYTGKEFTGYYVKIVGDKLDVGIDLIHDMLAHSKFVPAELRRERGVIIEEINMYKDNPRMHLSDLLEDALFGDTPLGWDIGGDEKSMRTMTRAQVLRYRELYYVPERMVVTLAGAVSDEYLRLAKQLFGSLKCAKQGAEFLPAPSFVPRTEPIVKIQKKETDQIQLAMGFPGYLDKHPDKYAMRLMSAILGGGMSSRLFMSVRERKGLAYSVGSRSNSLADTGFLAITAGLAKKQFVEAVATIMKETERLKRSSVTKKELAEAKTAVEGATLLGLEDCAERAEFYGSQVSRYGAAQAPGDIMKAYERVTREDILRVARETFDTSRMAIAAIGPFNSEADVLKPFLKHL